MQPFAKHSGLVAPLDRVNVDTDQMIPVRFCRLLTREGYGRFLFYSWRYLEGERPNPDFVLNRQRYQGASILLARANFGSGSSREHAPWGVLDYGFRVVIAPSFADIFYNNCFKNGILPVTLPGPQVDDLFQRTEQTEGYRLTVDLEKQTIANDGLELSFAIELDEIGQSLQHADRIAAFEKAHPTQAVMHDPVDVIISEPKP